MTGTAGGITTRPMTAADAVEVHAVGDRYMRAMQGRPMAVGPESLADQLTWPGRNLDLDVSVVLLDGRVVGFGSVWTAPPYSEIPLGGWIDLDLEEPVATGARQALVGCALAAARHYDAVGAPDPDRHVCLMVIERDTLMAAVAEAHGFRFTRQILLMEIDQRETAVAQPVWPSDVRVRPLTTDDAAVVGELLRDSFSEHPGDNDHSDGEVASFLSEPAARLDLSLLVDDDEGAIATIVASEQTDGGYVGVLGVRERARGRGLGTSLLRHVFRGFAAEGQPVVRLHVEQENSTGAVRLYEAAGMHPRTATQVWTRTLSD